MMDEEMNAAAGEYALGTLPPAERAAFAARIAVDRAAAEAVLIWERALAPLADGVAPVAPPVAVWPMIERRIGVAAPANDRGQAGPWRWATAAAVAIAAGLGATLALRPTPAPTAAPPVIAAAPAPASITFVATLNEGAAKPGLLLTVDPATGEVVAQPVGLVRPDGRALQLWWLAGTAAPRSVGLIDPARAVRLRVAPGLALTGSNFAVSVEPPGGSPTGAPTGPIPYVGAAFQLPPRS